MKRPTIPFALWRIAVDLPATRLIDSLSGREAVGCECVWCRNWKVVHERALPPELREDLARVGAHSAHPSDSYACSDDPLVYRLLYHCVGRILSGPDSRIEIKKPGADAEAPLDSAANFTRVSTPPYDVGAVVWYESTANHGPQQSWPTDAVQPLIRIDIMAPAPWGLAEPMPRRPPDPVERPRRWPRGRAV